MFLKAGEVAGGQLHKFVYDVGKLLGHNFKPWEAVNLAKDIGNVAQVAGMGLAVLGLAFEAYQDHKQARRADAEAELRLQVAASFAQLGEQVSTHFARELEDSVEPAMLGPVEARLAEVRAMRLRDRATDEQAAEELIRLQADVSQLLHRIHGTSGVR